MPRLAFVLLVASMTACAASSPARKPTEPLVTAPALVPPAILASESPAREDTAKPEATPEATPEAKPEAKPEVETCRIAGPSASLTIAIRAGTEEFAVAVRGARVTVVPRDRGVSSVEVTGALEFEGRTEGLEFFPSAPVEVASGVVQLGPMSVLQQTSPRRAELVARKAEVGSSFQLSEVSVPCSALAFLGSGDPSEDAHRGIKAPRLRSPSCPEPCTSYRTPRVLDFHASPGGGAHVQLTGSTIVAGLERRGQWTRVSTEDPVHMDGAQLTGWVKHSRLTKINGLIGFSGGRASLADPVGGAGWSTVSGPGIYHGPAHIDAGTPVFTLPAGGEPWATVRDSKAEFVVVIRPGSDHAEVWGAPFIPHIRQAWVSLKAVHILPAKPGP